MPKKLRAVDVIPDKLWITYDSSGKTGTMSPNSDDPQQYIQLLSTGEKVTYDVATIQDVFTFEGKADLSSWHQEHVFGYPVIKIETFKTQEKENLPCFTKTVASKVFFAAGYYGINFDNGGWLDAFCPKLATLRKYPYIGPFKTESDMSIAIQRKKRTND